MRRPTIVANENPLRRRSAIAGALGGLGLLFGGCVSQGPQGAYPDATLTQGAYTGPTPMQRAFAFVSHQFSERIQCPIERVGVRIESVTVDPPRPDVGADPERLAMYNRQVAAELETSRLLGVVGCGQAAMYRCLLRETRHGEGVGCVMVERGKLGIAITVATRTIERVEPGSLGEGIGFRAGDVLVALDHRPIADMADCVQQLNDPRSPGHMVTVQRAGAQIDLSVPRLGD
jgi:PDZ domain